MANITINLNIGGKTKSRSIADTPPPIPDIILKRGFADAHPFRDRKLKPKKKKQCTKGHQCGFSCVSPTKTCLADMTTAQLKAHNAAKRAERKAAKGGGSGGGGGAAQGKQPTENKPDNNKSTSTTESPTLKVRDYNPNAIKDLSPDKFRDYWYKSKPIIAAQDDPAAIHNTPYSSDIGTKKQYLSELDNAISMGFVPSDDAINSVNLTNKQKAKIEENRQEISRIREQTERIQKAIDYPLVTPEESARHKTSMSRQEAESYVKDSYMGNLPIWHGNPASVVDSITNDGADPEKNKNGFYGKGTYFGLEKETAKEYAGAAGIKAQAPENNNQVGIIEAKVNIKNPYIISSAEYDALLTKALPGDQTNGVDSSAVTAYVRARGHDSIYIRDLGYVVTGAREQVVVVSNQKIKLGSKEFAEIDIMNQPSSSVSDSITRYQETSAAKALNKKPSTDKPDFLKFTETDEDDFF